VDSPARVLAEVRRVLRPGGVLTTAEPDWDTVAVADEDLGTSRRFARFLRGQVRNPTIGRELPRLAARAGFAIDAVEAVAVLFQDFGTADKILGLRRNCARAVDAGLLAESAAGAWLSRLAAGPFVAGFTLYLARFSPADANGLEWQPDPLAGSGGLPGRT
jgi:SAM-dependent methyltransferase